MENDYLAVSPICGTIVHTWRAGGWNPVGLNG